jgi:alkylation response protein AidB-like acyl-CoA dehydrogenase
VPVEEENRLPIAITDEQLALQASIREWAKRADAIGAVRGLEPAGAGSAGGPAGPGWRPADVQPARSGPATLAGAGPAAERWASLADIGIFAIGLPAASGGAGGSTADLAAALAQLTESLVPGPVLPTLLARLALAAAPDSAAAGHSLPRIAAGEMSVAVALDPGGVTGAGQPDGSLLVRGTCGPVLGGGSSTHVLLSAQTTAGTGSAGPDAVRWLLLPADRTGIAISEHAPADFSRALGDVSLDAVTAGPGELLAETGTGAMRSCGHAGRRRGGRGRDLVLANGGRVRGNAASVRPADRRIPGRQAPVRRAAGPGRDRIRAGLGRGPGG